MKSGEGDGGAFGVASSEPLKCGGKEKREVKVAKNLWGLVSLVLSCFAFGQEWEIKCYKLAPGYMKSND